MKTEITSELIYEALRKGTLERKITPVYMGSAYKNKGVRANILDGVDYSCHVLPMWKMWRWIWVKTRNSVCWKMIQKSR